MTSTTEYLIDHSNFTGYAQTIVETTKNAAGQATKRIGYAFGTDEITQTTVTYDSSGVQSPATSLTFGHDAHGSVRVLFDALGALSQAFTYAAYGELLAIHNGLAQAVGTVGASFDVALLRSITTRSVSEGMTCALPRRVCKHSVASASGYEKHAVL